MPYPTPNDPAVDAPDRPGRGWYLLSLALLLVGVAAFVASISTARQQLDAAEEQLQRFVVPGQVTLRFDEPGEHHLYYEKFGELDGERFDTYRKYDGRMPRVLVTMTGPRGEPVEVEPVITEEPHRHRAHIYGGGRGNSEFVFDVERPGDHTLVIEPDSPFDDRLLMAAGPADRRRADVRLARAVRRGGGPGVRLLRGGGDDAGDVHAAARAPDTPG